MPQTVTSEKWPNGERVFRFQTPVKQLRIQADNGDCLDAQTNEPTAIQGISIGQADDGELMLVLSRDIAEKVLK